MTEEEKNIRQWLPLAYKIGRDYSRHCRGTAEEEDNISSAIEGLVKAAHTFAPGRAGFYTHARNMMVWAICEHRASSHMLMNRGTRTKARARGEEPPPLVSTSAIPDFDDRVAPEGLPDAFDTAADAERYAQFRQALTYLPPRTADAVRMYYGDELTLAEVGRRLKVTRQRANQIIKDGVAKLTALAQSPTGIALRPRRRLLPPVHLSVPKESARRWAPADANGFSTHYLCNGTGKLRIREKGRLYTRTCLSCKGRGHARLAEPLACAV